MGFVYSFIAFLFFGIYLYDLIKSKTKDTTESTPIAGGNSTSNSLWKKQYQDNNPTATSRPSSPSPDKQPNTAWHHASYPEESGSYYSSPPKRDVVVTNRSNLTSWALHKQPGDIDLHDYILPAGSSACTIIHYEGGVYKLVKGRDKGRILSSWEIDDYIDSL